MVFDFQNSLTVYIFRFKYVLLQMLRILPYETIRFIRTKKITFKTYLRMRVFVNYSKNNIEKS